VPGQVRQGSRPGGTLARRRHGERPGRPGPACTRVLRPRSHHGWSTVMPD